MKNFKQVITTNKNLQVGKNQKKTVMKNKIDFTVSIDSNFQIADLQPRTYKDVDLFSKYHGRAGMLSVSDFIYELNNL